jgi:hypothetical protein
MAEAEANHAILGNQLVAEGLEDEGEAGDRVRRETGARIQAAKMREFITLGVVLGYRYENSPVIAGDGTQAPPPDFINYVPSSRPGHLAPHAWLHDGSSLYDHFGAGLTLVATAGADIADLDAARAQAASFGLPLTVLQPAEGGVASLYPARYTLVRPDQHVAWRGDAWPADGVALLRRLSGH